jgi:hypothetical protein
MVTGDVMKEDPRLTNLMNYTVFHIGVYVTGTAALIGAGLLISLDHPIFRFALGCFLIAGACGGIVANGIRKCRTYEEFERTPLGFGEKFSWHHERWTRYEHLAFWLGLLALVVPNIFLGPAGFKGNHRAWASLLGLLPFAVVLAYSARFWVLSGLAAFWSRVRGVGARIARIIPRPRMRKVALGESDQS